MESDRAATSSRRSERSSSTQGVYMPSLGEEMDGVAPKCRCGVYAILYLSKTSSNPNRLFFGCPFFKEKWRNEAFRSRNGIGKQNRTKTPRICVEEHAYACYIK
ncbi:hypothetical protein PIB30_065681 [Stylosanthes scabra]|uniref:Zinc finger GRF-type domain-containing protein n=1 Tax=Stylosanthes scabra TaxID=79078 RepID=A0ABU6QMP5_9FABA|nr:hypothetical protein [Stylosanthes scabra]